MKSEGIAFITGLLVGLFILCLCLFYLTFLHDDVRFSGIQKVSFEAYYLARSGVEYYKATGRPATKNDPTEIVKIPQGDDQHVVEIIYSPDGNLYFTGKVKTIFGIVRAEKTLVAPGLDLTKIYEK